MTLVGDIERERATLRLREHFVRGRLTLAELSDRTEQVLRARSSDELRSALAGLPGGGSVARTVWRGAALALLTSAWLLFSFVLLVVFSLTLLIHGSSTTELAGFLAVWLIPTYLLSRVWRRTLPRHTHDR